MLNRKRSARRARLSFGALLLGLTMLLSGTAYAQAFTHPSTITIFYDGSSFSGTVGSTDTSCRNLRTVTVFKETGAVDQTVGSATTDSSGNYTVLSPGAAGDYYAQVSTRTTGGYGFSVTCQAATSSTITVGASPSPTASPSTSPTSTTSVSPSPTAIESVATTVSIGHDGKKFFGTVASSNPGCVSGRTVEVVKVSTGAVIGTTNAAADGQWSIPREKARGRFFARAPESSAGPVVCLAGQSNTIRVRKKHIPKQCKDDPDSQVGTNGNDTMVLDGTKRACGKDGHDTAIGDNRDNEFYGGPGSDHFKGKGGEDTGYGGEGKDVLEGGEGDDTLVGGPGNDTLNGDKGDDDLSGNQDNDDLDGGPDDDACSGGPGEDSLTNCE